jgi:hypothetical protein
MLKTGGIPSAYKSDRNGSTGQARRWNRKG